MPAATQAAMSITRPKIEAYLRRLYPAARVVAIAPLGGHDGELKAHGYGQPIQVSFEVGGEARQAVLRTMAPDRFGHDRRADRAAALILAADTWGAYPRHVQALDLGAIDREGSLVSTPPGEPYLLTSYAEGRLYAEDLARLAREPRAVATDLARAKALALYLASLHGEPADPAQYTRSIRDMLGHGEGVFGLVDSFAESAAAARPPSKPPAGSSEAKGRDLIATPGRLEALELAAVRWRWRLRAFSHRARRTHGDFHPFNLLFRQGDDFSVLDASRGGAGEPADDVVALSINYVFFALALGGRSRFDGALRELWSEFWRSYLSITADIMLTKLVAPFFAWRVLVLVSPLWYPNVPDRTRETLLRFAEHLLAGADFDPARVDRLLA
jgi:hypothetical protein